MLALAAMLAQPLPLPLPPLPTSIQTPSTLCGTQVTVPDRVIFWVLALLADAISGSTQVARIKMIGNRRIRVGKCIVWNPPRSPPRGPVDCEC